MIFFFFQAEDGIRDYKVTGVQTCALPIYGDLGDDRARGLHAAARRARDPAARLHVSHPELGHHRERDRLTLAERRLADGVVRMAGVRRRPAEWRSLRNQLPAPHGRAQWHLRDLPRRRDPARPLLVVAL